MTVTFFSNFLNDHQLPFCMEMVERLGENKFHFVAHEKIDPERVAMGFADMNEMYPFVVKSYEGGCQEEMAKKLMLDSDVVIIGSYRNMPFDERLKQNKLTFRYNERLLKTGDWRWLDHRVHMYVWTQWTKYRNKRLYELCASAYTARDLSLFGFPKSKCFKWGYFPVVKEYDDVDAVMLAKRQTELKHSQDVSILWVARLIEWKHPEYPVLIAKRLRQDGYRFSLDMIGIGKMRNEIQTMIEKYQLQDCVRLLGGMPPADVRKHMEASEIFLFTSDRNEGWGAVLNESLNSGCAVVANRAIGSVPFLLENGVNGLIYNNSIDDAYMSVKRLMDDADLRRKLGKAGYATMTKKWSAKNAVSNLFTLISSLQCDTGVTPIKDGPCSKIDTVTYKSNKRL